MCTTRAQGLGLVGFGLVVLSIHAFGHGQEVAPGADTGALKKRAKAVIDAVSPAIVSFAYGEEPGLALGCGVIVTADGHVAISGPVHAVIDDNLLVLRLTDGRRVRGKALGWSSELGFGMLKITDSGPWPHVEIGDQTRVGDVCVALGYPRDAADQVFRPGIRLGVITRSADGQWLTTSHRSDFTAHPVFDLNGKLLGLNTSMPVGGDPIHARAELIADHWDDLVAGKNLDRVRLISGSIEEQRTVSHPEVKEVDAAAIARAKTACVRISGIGDKTSLASGVIVTPDGYVITCGHHQRMPGEKLTLNLYDGRRASAMVLGTNLISDVGVLKITDDGTWPHAEMGHSAAMRYGEPCVLIGYPRATTGQEPWVFATEVIKPTQTLSRRDEWYCRFWTAGYPESIGGASGGGVFNAQGRVIGVLLGGAGQEMQHSRVELFRKNWKLLTAGKPVEIVDASLVTQSVNMLDRVARELSGDL